MARRGFPRSPLFVHARYGIEWGRGGPQPYQQDGRDVLCASETSSAAGVAWLCNPKGTGCLLRPARNEILSSITPACGCPTLTEGGGWKFDKRALSVGGQERRMTIRTGSQPSLSSQKPSLHERFIHTPDPAPHPTQQALPALEVIPCGRSPARQPVLDSSPDPSPPAAAFPGSLHRPQRGERQRLRRRGDEFFPQRRCRSRIHMDFGWEWTGTGHLSEHGMSSTAIILSPLPPSTERAPPRCRSPRRCR